MRRAASLILTFALALGVILLPGGFTASMAAGPGILAASGTSAAGPGASPAAGTSPAAPGTPPFSDVSGLPCEEAVKVLTDLKVVSGYEDGTYRPATPVTRAEMAVLVIKALGLQNMVGGAARNSFSDLSGYEWAEASISYAQSAGIIKGYGDGTFQPGKTVSYDEAATMLITALGYTAECLPGEWPAAFSSQARALGILDGIEPGSGGANRGDIAVMLYQTLDQKIGTASRSGQWAPNRGPSDVGSGGDGEPGDRMIYRLGADPRETWTGIITGEEYSDLNMKSYMGAYATLYRKEGKVIAVADVQSQLLRGNFEGWQTFAGKDDVDYMVHDSVDSVYTFRNGTLVDQGVSLSSITSVSSQGALICAQVSEKTIRRVHSVMSWEENDAAKVKAADLAAIGRDGELLGYSFDTLKDGAVDANSFELLGAVSLGAIKVNNIVAVYTKDKKESADINRVEVGTQVIRGELSKVRQKSDPLDDVYTVAGKDYTVSSLAGATNLRGAMEVGDRVTFYLDYDGHIYDLDVTSGSKYGIITSAARKYGYKDDYSIELLSSDGRTKTYEIDEKQWERGVQTTGSGITKGGIVSDASITDSTIVGTLVKYDTNKSGQINRLELISEFEGKGKLSVDRTFFADRKIASAAAVFVKNTGFGSSDKWKTYNLNAVKTNKEIDDAWFIRDSNDKIRAIAFRDISSVGTSDNYGFVSSFSSTTNGDGDKVFEIDAVVNGARVRRGLTDAQDDEYRSHSIFYRFDRHGSVFTGAEEARIITSAAVRSSLNEGDVAVLFAPGGPVSGPIADSGTSVADLRLNGVNIQAYKVFSRESRRLEVMEAGHYEVLDQAKVIVPRFDGGSFDCWDVGNVSGISANGFVIMLQVDEDHGGWDTVIYVSKNDLSDFEKAFAGLWF